MIYNTLCLIRLLNNSRINPAFMVDISAKVTKDKMFSQKAFPGEGKCPVTPSIFKTAKRLSRKVYIFVCIDDSTRYDAEIYDTI